MEQLEIRFYPREEIAKIIGIDPKNQNFKRKVSSVLNNWGYSFTYGKKSFTITRKPQTPKERLNEIMIRRYDLDI